MGSLYKQPGSDNYWIRYTRDGKQIRKSTGTSDEGEARLQLRELELLLGQDSQNGRVSKQLARAIQSETIHPIALKTYLEGRRKHVAPKTRALYKSRDNIFVEWLERNCPDVADVSDVHRAMIVRFLEYIREHHTARTRNGYLRRLRSVFNSAVKEGFALDDPTAGLPFLPEEASKRRPFTERELKQLLGVVTGDVRLLSMLGLYAAAMRMHDIVSLTWQNIDLKRDQIRWRMHKRRGKWMEIAIHPALRKELLAVKAAKRKGPVLRSFEGKVSKASEAFRKALVKAELKVDHRTETNERYERRQKERTEVEQQGRKYVSEPPKGRKDELDFHCLRYNFVSILKQQGCPEAIARSIMGHASAEVNAIYTHIDADSERKWIARLPDITQ